jgi:hypothetical protein
VAAGIEEPHSELTSTTIAPTDYLPNETNSTPIARKLPIVRTIEGNILS